MASYYNEIDPYAAQWLRNLIDAGHIAPGDVDERSIADVRSDDVKGYTQCHFFAGIGIWSHAIRSVGIPDDFPIWSGSCPCQPFSMAGRQKGVDDERHLWPVWSRLISECRPHIVFGEQVSSKGGRAWWDVVANDLEGLGYAAGALDTSAAGVGAPHVRQRLFWVANASGERLARQRLLHIREGRKEKEFLEVAGRGAPDPVARPASGWWRDAVWAECSDGKNRPVERGSFPLDHGNPGRMEQLRAYGNALCSPQAQEFLKAAMDVIP